MENKTFEEALNELEKIVKELESGSVDLDNAIKKYSEAMSLAKFCSDKIKNATEAVFRVCFLFFSRKKLQGDIERFNSKRYRS